MDTLVTVIFWISTLVVAAGIGIAYGSGWRAVADALATLERSREGGESPRRTNAPTQPATDEVATWSAA